MANEKIEEFSTERLNKRKKFVSILLVILIAAAVLDGAAIIFDLITGDGFETFLFIPAIVCSGFAIYMYMGLKNVNKELAHREDN
jgi:hypothetical protein